MNTYDRSAGFGTHTELEKHTDVKQKERKWRTGNDWPQIKSPHRDSHPVAKNKSKDIEQNEEEVDGKEAAWNDLRPHVTV